MNDDGRIAYSVAEAAELCGVHPNTIYEAVSSGQLSAARIGKGRRMRISRAALDEWLKAPRQDS